ncbi:MAG: DUF1573 domain-containing protein [Lentimicrobiaceae bacterium]|nr:DUF1573 domain-containing protein [Lentimicrobiaceae bacterium]
MKIFIVSMLAILFAGWQPLQAQFIENQTSGTMTSANQNPKIKWVFSVIDLGEVPINVPAEAIFEFSNISSEPVIITSVKSSCGCTVPDFSKEPVLPGASSTVSAIYNARALGPFQKTVTVITSDNLEHKLTLKGKVVENKPQPE